MDVCTARLYSSPRVPALGELLIYALLTVLLSMGQRQASAKTLADTTFQQLASITNDRNADFERLGVLLRGGQVVGLRFDTINGGNPHQSEFSIADMRAGAVLDGDATHKALVLRGSIDAAGKADVTITYLSNGLFGRYRDCRARIVRDDHAQWHILNVYDHKWVDHLVVQTWALGIFTIGGICPG